MLRADRRTRVPDSPSAMDTPGCCRDRSRGPAPGPAVPRLTLSGEPGGSLAAAPGFEDGGRLRGGGRRYKSVTMAPASMYLSERRYVARRPLFASEQQPSILKKTTAHESRREEDVAGKRPSPSPLHAEMDITRRYASPRHAVTSAGLNLQHTPHPSSADSTLREDLTSPLGVSDLRAGPSLLESAFASPFLGDGSDRGSLSSPSLEAHSPTSPPSPRLTSSQLPPAVAPHLRLSRALWSEDRPGRRSRAGAREREGGGAETYLTKSSSMGYLLQSQASPNLEHMSPHQANYWACAIPRSLPPSPDRQSPSWNPDREYQDLLDYTYPLRPGMGAGGRQDLPKQGGSLLRVGDRGLQDSGIELDGFCSSSSLSGLDLWLNGTGSKSQQVWVGNGGLASPELPGLPGSWDSLPLASPLPPHADPVGLSLESLDSSPGPAGGTRPSPGRVGGQHHQRLPEAPLRTQTVSSSSFCGVRTTSLLFPRPRCTSAQDWDEEFRPLPDQLEELQSLANQVREVTAVLCRPLALTGSLKGLGSGDPSYQGPFSRAQIPGTKEEAREKDEKVAQAVCRGGLRTEETPGNDVTGGRRAQGPPLGPVGRAALRDVEALVEQLSGVCLRGLHRQGPSAAEEEEEEEEEGSSVSLMQHIQVFCSNLEQLIGWLYTVAHKMEALAPPTADLQSVKSSFAQYQSFQKEVTSHQPLAASVLHTGELLLSCINSTSPVLRDTLVLIERQTKALESNAENLFSAILSAMDNLTQTDTQTSRQTDQQTDTQTSRQTDQQTDTQTSRQTDQQPDRKTD